MVVDVGEVRRHIKPKADSTLHNMRKSGLIEYIRCLEHNYNVAVSFNENQAKYVESLNILPKVPGSWEEWWPGDCALIMTGEEKLYRCSICDAKYPDVEGFNFCPHCGNPMDSKSINAKLPDNPVIHSYGERDSDG